MVVYNDLAATFSALGDPTRLEILAYLARGSATCNELVARFDISQQAVSKHIRVLRRANLLRQEKQGRVRMCELEPDALDRATRWIEQHRALWTQRFDQLEAYLKENRNVNTSCR